MHTASGPEHVSTLTDEFNLVPLTQASSVVLELHAQQVRVLEGLVFSAPYAMHKQAHIKNATRAYDDP